MYQKKIHLLLVVRWPVGGIRTFCKYVYNNFDKSKYRFTILAPNVEELDTLVEDLSGFDIKIVKDGFDGDMAYLNLKTVFKTILKGSFDALHSHGLSAGIYCALPAKIAGLPHIMTSHDVFTEKQMKGLNGLLKKILFSALLPLASTIHHVSYDARDNMFAYIPLLKKISKNNIVIPNGIDIHSFMVPGKREFHKELDLPNNTFLIGFMGRFMAQKGFKYLIEAMEILLKKNDLKKQPIVLSFGWGGFIREEQIIIRQKGLEKYFIFLPFTADISSSLKGLDVLAIPSLWEACPLLPMEGMTAGTTVIGTNCVGLREVLKDTTAIIVPAKDSMSLSDALIHEMYNPSKEKAGNFVNIASKRFDVKKQAEKLEAEILKMFRNSSKQAME